ncbi:radical SAM protein [Patescibacteria group bacterium]|nr:radical SAM protein [Patescibacteria group bacterium]
MKINKLKNQNKPLDLVGMDFTDVEIKKAVKKNKALALALQYGYNCSLNCRMCYAAKGEELKKLIFGSVTKLSFKEYDNLFLHAKKIGIKSVYISGEGEPMHNVNEFFKLVELINKNQLTPIVFTNGTNINRQVAKKINKYNISIIGKLLSFNPKNNNNLVGNNNAYKYLKVGGYSVPSHIKYLIEEGLAKQNRLAVNCIVNKLNYVEIPKIWKWMRDQNIIPFMEFIVLSGNAKNNLEIDVAEKQRISICKKIYNLDQKLGYQYKYSLGPFIGHRKCDSRPLLMIDLFGNCRVCACTYFSIGDIRKESLSFLIKKNYEIEKQLNRTYKNDSVFCECAKYIKKRP